MTINAVVTFAVVPGANEQFEAAFAEARESFLKDEGCLRYDMQKVQGSDVDYVLLETYESQAAIDLHHANPSLRTLRHALKGAVASGPNVTLADPVGEQVGLAV